MNGIRALASSLANSLSQAVLQVEQARAALLGGRGIPQDMVAGLSRLLGQDKRVDNRNYELLPDIGGTRLKTRDMTELGGVVSERCLRSYAGTLVALENFSNPGAVGEVDLSEDENVRTSSGTLSRS